MIAMDVSPALRAAGVTATGIALLAGALAIGPKHAGLYGLFVITWIGLMGLNIVFGHGGQFNLAQNTLYGIGAFAYGVLTTRGMNPWLGVAIGTAFGAFSGAAMTFVAGRVRGLGLAILTLGIALATPDLFSATSLTGGFNGIVGVPPLSVGDKVLAGNGLLVVLAALAFLVLLLTRYWLTSSWGSALRTVAADPEAAAGMGLNPSRYRTLALTLGGAIIGFAGALYGAYQGYLGYLSFPVTMVILWYLGVILGGAGTIWGPLIGAGVITVVPETLPVSDDLQPVLWGALLVAFVVLAPRGVVAGLHRLMPRPSRSLPLAETAVAAPSGDLPERGRPGGGVVLDVEAMTKRIGGLEILRDVSLQLRAGTVTALLGANGAGKSTLVNCLSGYLPPTSGTVRLDGIDITGAPPTKVYRHGLVRTFQHPRLVTQSTVFENVLAGVHAVERPNALLSALPAIVTRKTRRRQDRAVSAMLTELGIGHLAGERVGDLSAGNRQVVSIARSLMANPAVLLLDEPVAGLSLEEMRRAAETINIIGSRGVAVLVIEHRLDFVRSVAEDAYCLDSGLLIAHGTLDQVLGDPEVRKAFLGTAEAKVPTSEPVDEPRSR
ncbi:branched-chain amino acid ABC transporter ATP-binding protein/permease [Spirillospora sp. NPDC048819]|uniref:branched-chain amino acid ABC transporter ATP-binding protein/permease n=1 Tax=Spirillospora sp. NPDC048819 TaxID=3155268 RepID=UPI0033F33C9A